MKKACTCSHRLSFTMRLSTSLHSATNKNVTCPRQLETHVSVLLVMPPMQLIVRLTMCASFCTVLQNKATQRHVTQCNVGLLTIYCNFPWTKSASHFTIYPGTAYKHGMLWQVMKLSGNQQYGESVNDKESDRFLQLERVKLLKNIHNVLRGFNKPQFKTMNWKAMISKA